MLGYITDILLTYIYLYASTCIGIFVSIPTLLFPPISSGAAVASSPSPWVVSASGLPAAPVGWLDHGLIAAHTVVFLEDESIATVQWLLIHAHHTVIVLLFYSVSESAIDIVFESQASSKHENKKAL